MTTLAILLLAAALAVAIYGTIEQGRAIEDLRERVDALAHPRSGPDTLTTAERAALFTGLYSVQDAEPAVQRLVRLPAVRPVVAAALLALAGSGLVVSGASRPAASGTSAEPRTAKAAAAVPATPAPVDSLTFTRSERDSLAALVAQLRDSIRLASAAASPRAASARRQPPGGTARRLERKDPLIPPAPKLELPPVTP